MALKQLLHMSFTRAIILILIIVYAAPAFAQIECVKL
jgi:hypothetical protein